MSQSEIELERSASTSQGAENSHSMWADIMDTGASYLRSARNLVSENPGTSAAIGTALAVGAVVLTRGKFGGALARETAAIGRSEVGNLSALTNLVDDAVVARRSVEPLVATTRATATEFGQIQILDRALPNSIKVGPNLTVEIEKLTQARSTYFGPQYVSLTTGKSIGRTIDVGPLNYLKSRPMEQSQSFLGRVGDIEAHGLSKIPFRRSPDLSSPVAVLNEQSRVAEIVVPMQATKAELTKAMTAAANAERIFTVQAADDASSIALRVDKGLFATRTRLEHLLPPAERMPNALKGSYDWVSGAPGNNYTRFLRDWQGEFTDLDAARLRRMFSTKAIRSNLAPIHMRDI